mmetsp:Transcript_9719/g.13642  ORF Transcript_9719/g.13642 Transcript_9719/m.13642 type:complete len:322 (-) Transcript_9719:19-984(-)|eukprot:CAMPEP_0171477260 /NCGR_PEP_ID=MMETSP0946-20130122/4074_1 /TAXON_ID=109269 /ORGANISM="Vaucheria litorea, Strain CCMP2940" /LENGTH=321 /DNA_ID=CAMNT_0012007667 /DNA_START=192 /DNA_END=1157 /DNA_ORIENTATION=-
MASSMIERQAEKSSSHLRAPSPDPISFNIDFNSVKALRYLSSGSMCNVYAGVYQGDQVVLKVPKKEKFDLASQDLDNELQLLQLFNHPNICKLYGAGVTPEGFPFICIEQLNSPTLAGFLGTDSSTEGGAEVLGRWLKRTFYMSLQDGLKHAISLASALNYMHCEVIPGAVIMHRDFKSSNMAFDASGNIKLYDFGLSKILKERDRKGCSERYKLTGNTGSLRYMAPEVALNLPYDEKADVYSYGILLWELASLKRPFDLYTVKDFKQRVAIKGERPPLDPEWPVELRNLLSRCWGRNIGERPSMGDVISELYEVLDILQN